MTGKRALYRRKLCTKTPCSVLYLVGIYSKSVQGGGGEFQGKRTAIVDLDKLDAYIEELGAEEMERREQSRIMNSRSKSDKLAEFAK